MNILSMVQGAFGLVALIVGLVTFMSTWQIQRAGTARRPELAPMLYVQSAAFAGIGVVMLVLAWSLR